MTLHVFTSRKWLRDPDLLDVTRVGGDPVGLAFAPSWALLADAKGFNGHRPISSERYAELYIAEMRVSWGLELVRPWSHWTAEERLARARGVVCRREHWDGVRAHDRAVFGCYEVDPGACHRSLLAQIFVTLGAVYGGEIPMPARSKKSA